MQLDFEVSVKDTLEGVSGLWARLEVLHTGVTLTKHWGPGHKDLASAWTDLEVGVFSHQSGGWTGFDLIFICFSLAWLCSYYVFGQGFVLCYGHLLKQTAGLSEPPEGLHGTAAGRRLLMQIKTLRMVEIEVCHSMLLI